MLGLFGMFCVFTLVCVCVFDMRLVFVSWVWHVFGMAGVFLCVWFVLVCLVCLAWHVLCAFLMF